jgi:hypothetical protein
MLAGKGLIQCSSVSRQQTRILGHLVGVLPMLGPEMGA